MSKYLMLGLLAVAVSCPSALAVITIDGLINDWPAENIWTDPIDNPGAVELTRWGALVENGNLYVFAEIDPASYDISYFYETPVGTTKARRIYPGLWIDVDRSGATGVTPPGDGKAWPTPEPGVYYGGTNMHDGLDINHEWGAGWFDGARPGDVEEYYFWGTGDDMGNDPILGPGPVGDEWAPVDEPPNQPGAKHAYSGHIMEFMCTIDELTTKVAQWPDGAVVGSAMKVAMGIQGTGRDAAPAYGYDLVPPRNLAIIPGDCHLEDGDVDLDDLRVLAANYDATVPAGNDGWVMGDFNNDGIVELDDLRIMAANYGYGTSVPEPTIIALLGLGALGLIRKRR